MGSAKRHHWWPIVQSRYWTNKNGHVAVTRANGTTFRANPLNLGVESELYTRFGPDDSKDLEIEEWFASEIDGPASTMIEHLLDPANTRQYRFSGDPKKANVLRTLGYRVRPHVGYVALDANLRRCIARYLAALLVRHPIYLERLKAFHIAQKCTQPAKNQALDNMLELFELYAKRIEDADLVVVRRTCAAELMYADGGLVVDEPWRMTHGIPFDLHAPLTPDLAIEVLPLPSRIPRDPWVAPIMEATNIGVARYNRIVLGVARRFVFTRQDPPLDFIAKNFGVPAPKNIGYRINDGRLETYFDPSRS